MGKGPGLYSGIGKKARDLLYKDYQTDHKFTVSTQSPTGVAITSSGSKKGDRFVADVNIKLKSKKITTHVKVDTNSNLYTTITVDEPIPGWKATFSFRVPDQRSEKIEVQYLHEYVGINTSVALAASPVVNLSGVVGTHALSLGTDVAFDTKAGAFTKYNAGLSFTSSDLIASLSLSEKGDMLSASYYHNVRPLTNIGAELTHRFSKDENTLTLGTQCQLDSRTTVKARMNSLGKASALIQREWRPKSLFSVSGEVDTKSLDKSPKFGLALTLKP